MNTLSSFKMGTILYLDDEEENLEIFQINFRHYFNVILSSTVSQAINFLQNTPIEVIIVDYKMPEQNGVEFLTKITADYPDIVKIILTAFDQPSIIINSINKARVFGFVTKPWDKEELRSLIDSGIEIFRLRQKNKELITSLQAANSSLTDALKEVKQLKSLLESENQYLKDEITREKDHRLIVGQSASVSRLNTLIEQVTNVNTNVLITGETGTGKELVARSIHLKSARSNKPFLKLNCAALPASLVESELFGFEKGSFSGALQGKQGLFEIAHGGTVFLDEIGEMPIDIQPKLLRFIQEKEFFRVGGTRSIRVDVRLIAATNRVLPALIKAGRFRADLYYRLNVFPINVPSLRERLDDIPELLNHFIGIYERKLGIQVKEIPSQTIKNLMLHDWPGNIRELESYVERSIIENSDTGILAPAAIDIDVFEFVEDDSSNGFIEVDHLERQQIIEALQKSNWKISGPNGAAALLNINRNTLRARMLKLKIVRRL
jgi:formate hydrogenlyase transcriptional activator